VDWGSPLENYAVGPNPRLAERNDWAIVVHSEGRSLGKGVYIRAQYHVFRLIRDRGEGLFEVAHMVSIPVRWEYVAPPEPADVRWRHASGPHDNAPAQVASSGRLKPPQDPV